MRDMIKVMEKEKHTSLPLNSVDIVTASGHVVDQTELVASYVLSCVRVA